VTVSTKPQNCVSNLIVQTFLGMEYQLVGILTVISVIVIFQTEEIFLGRIHKTVLRLELDSLGSH
jgi:hypothetical protein